MNLGFIVIQSHKQLSVRNTFLRKYDLAGHHAKYSLEMLPLIPTLGTNRIKSSLGVMVDSKLNINQQSVLVTKVNSILAAL